MEKEKGKNILDILLDEHNHEPIILDDGKGKKIAFEQIAVLPFDRLIYCILKPIDKIEGVEEDEGIVFYVAEEGKDYKLIVEQDEAKAIQVFNNYYTLYEEKKGG